MNQITVYFFAIIKERVGTNHILLELPEKTTVRNMKDLLLERYPNLQGTLGSALIAVNHEYAFEEDILPEEAEVALFPPVSGGVLAENPTIVMITEDTIDLNDLLEKIVLPTTGAAGLFTGMVRQVTSRGGYKQTEYLEYEAYKPMAEIKMHQVADEIRSRWPTIEGIAIVQRIGRLTKGTPTVLIACTSPHRDTGVFDAAKYGIDRLKEIVPVWKKEVSSTGEIWIEGEYIPSLGE